MVYRSIRRDFRKEIIEPLIQLLSMAAKKLRDEAVQDFLWKSADDLESAKLLYDNKHFDNCLYLLQQSSEKLAKALWLMMGFLTPKRAREDRAIKYWLGFQPKEPIQYGHRILPHLISDVDKMLPSIQGLVRIVEDSELAPRVANFLVAYHKSRKSVKKLKKKPFAPIASTEQLERDVKTIKNILDAIDPTVEKTKEELHKLDFTDIAQIASSLARRMGFTVSASQILDELPSPDKIKSGIVQSIRISVLAVMSAAMASLLDPLESATRYPNPQSNIFDENHPYIRNFMRLYDAVACLLQKSRLDGPTLAE